MPNPFIAEVVKAQAPRPLHTKVPKTLVICRWYATRRCKWYEDNGYTECPHAKAHRHYEGCFTKNKSGDCGDVLDYDSEFKATPDCVALKDVKKKKRR